MAFFFLSKFGTKFRSKVLKGGTPEPHTPTANPVPMDDNLDFTNLPVPSFMADGFGDDLIDIDDAAAKVEAELNNLTSRIIIVLLRYFDSVAQYQWVVSWLEKHRLLKTLDTLLDEGAEIASETFSTATQVAQIIEDDDYAQSLKASYELHGGQNILATRFHPDAETKLLASGSTDRTVTLSDWGTGKTFVTVYGAHKAPILSLDWNPVHHSRLLVGSVDNSATVVEFKGWEGSSEDRNITYEVIGRFPVHTKHVVRVAWSPDGRKFATASYDHSMKIFAEKSSTTTSSLGTPIIEYEMVKEIVLGEAVESICWTPDQKWLVASARVDNYLHYFDCTTADFIETKFNMNAAGDDHVSFTAMDTKVSADGKYLLVCTDRNRVIMFIVGTPLQYRNFYDVPNGEWCTPRAVWNQSGTHIYISSEDIGIYVYSVTSTSKKTVLVGHQSNVRDVCIHPKLDVIATASFDKTVKIWE